MAPVVKLIFVILSILRSKARVACTSGECIIDCELQTCDIVICTNYASSCLISCSDGQCEGSQFYLAARNYNTVYCFGNDACNQINIQCGGPDMPPIGYSEYDFIGRYDSKLKCNFVSKPSPTNNPTYHPTMHPTIQPTKTTTNRQIRELNVESAQSTSHSSKSILGMELLIVLGCIGLFCLMFTICFCICMAVDHHHKMIILRQQTENSEKHVAELPCAILDKPNAINPVISTSDTIAYHSRNTCIYYGDMDKSNTKSSIDDKSRSAVTSSCNNNNNNNNNSNAASSNAPSADFLSVAVPSFSSTQMEIRQSEKSGDIDETHTHKHNHNHKHQHMQAETESETNLATLNELESSRMVMRKRSEDTSMTMNTVRIHSSSDSVLYMDPPDCQLCDFSKMLMERQNSVDISGVYHD